MAKKLAVIFGIIFVIVGILGYIPNPVIGAEGTFVTDNVHNIVHIVIGIILLIAASRGENASALSLKVFGVIYLILFVNGLISPEELLGFVASNQADTWLHLVLGVVLLIGGFMGGNKSAMVMDKSTM